MPAINSPFTPGQCAVVTAATAAASLTIPTAYAGRPHQIQVQVASGANAAFSFTGTAVAPDGTPSGAKLALLGGTSAIWTVPLTATAISYIRVGGSDATVYITFGDGS